ncbi:flavin reductase [Rhodococcus rhodnii]|uniref:Oxidoreductase n=2 Tax=Rhodococcus rhodnii TaxID=38312 RepID=R7WQ92_9NOCA|nr:flavin reductase family protein [Rhodococcus rhodnii]EOM77473.1 oxidoreductase [Rhodococcus rhodnii LMG 5362]TXG90348.1 flavin reductase [Rhodococcus rhodnii]
MGKIPVVTTESTHAPTPEEMRRLMGRFASGVTIVTALDDDEPVGFACQSFASVSLDPPLVLFCAAHSSRSWPRIRSVGRFAINVLAEPQSDVCGAFGTRDGRKFDGLDWNVSPWGTPSLDGVLMRVHAELHDVHVAGDHDVVVGRVLGLESGAAERPMLFYCGRFGIETPEV